MIIGYLDPWGNKEDSRFARFLNPKPLNPVHRMVQSI